MAADFPEGKLEKSSGLGNNSSMQSCQYRLPPLNSLFAVGGAPRHFSFARAVQNNVEAWKRRLERADGRRTLMP
jgi:hypothetical protein